MITPKLCRIALAVVATASASTVAFALPAYVVPTGATNCDSCHLDNFGTGFKPGVLEAAASPLGKIPGLTAFLHPAPIVTGADTKPVLHPINDQWDVTVGETALAIPVRISDAEDDSFTLQGSSVPAGTSVALPTPDVQSNLAMSVLRWKPTTTQANKTYTVSITAKETGTGRVLASDAITTKVRVWPARASAATKKVSQFMIQAAQWNNNQLLLTGKVLFKSKVTAAQRATLLAQLKMNVKSEVGTIIGAPLALTADTAGNWTSTLALTDSQVPCAVRLDYEGLNVARTVKLAPAATCIQ